MFIPQPRLTLIEAGPGEIDLITVKGLKALRGAKVILYDASVNETLLLEYAAADALKIYLGEKGRFKALSKNDIKDIIVEYAAIYGQVVQVKGALSTPIDQEIIQYVRSKGLHTEYIPGVQPMSPYHAVAVPSSN